MRFWLLKYVASWLGLSVQAVGYADDTGRHVSALLLAMNAETACELLTCIEHRAFEVARGAPVS